MAQAQLPVGYPLTTAITYFNLCKNLMETDAAITWCQRLKLLPSSKWCSCGRGMHLVNRKGCSDGVTWRCPRKQLTTPCTSLTPTLVPTHREWSPCGVRVKGCSGRREQCTRDCTTLTYPSSCGGASSGVP